MACENILLVTDSFHVVTVTISNKCSYVCFRSKMGNISNESVQKSKPNMTQKKAICVIRSTDCLEFHLRNEGMKASELHRSNTCFHVASQVTKPMESIRSEQLILRVLHNLHNRHDFKKIGRMFQHVKDRLHPVCVQYSPSPVCASLSMCLLYFFLRQHAPNAGQILL